MKKVLLERYAGRKDAWNCDGRTYFDDVFDMCSDELWSENMTAPQEHEVMERAIATIKDAFEYGGDDE